MCEVYCSVNCNCRGSSLFVSHFCCCFCFLNFHFIFSAFETCFCLFVFLLFVCCWFASTFCLSSFAYALAFLFHFCWNSMHYSSICFAVSITVIYIQFYLIIWGNVTCTYWCRISYIKLWLKLTAATSMVTTITNLNFLIIFVGTVLAGRTVLKE